MTMAEVQTREEKVDLFSKLQSKYTGLVERLKLLENRCGDVNVSDKAEKVLENKIKRERNELEYKQDPDLPEGWKFGEYISQNSPETIKVWISPAGRRMQGGSWIYNLLSREDGMDELGIVSSLVMILHLINPFSP